MTHLLYTLNLAAFALLTLGFPLWLSHKLHLPVWNPIVLSMLFTVPIDLFKAYLGPAFLLDDGLYNPYYNYAIWMSNLELLCSFVVAHRLLGWLDAHRTAFLTTVRRWEPAWQVRRTRVFVTAMLFLLLFLFFWVVTASSSLGVAGWIASPRTGYQFHRSGAGQYYALALLCLSTSYALLLLFVRRRSQVVLGLAVYLCFAFLLGSKNILLNFSIYAVIILWYHRIRHIGRKMLVLLPLCFVPMLLNFGSFDLQQIISYFDYYINSAHYYEARFSGEIDLFHGRIALTQAWGMVPRSLVPDKPYVYGMTLVTDHFFPGAAEETHTPAFGGPVRYFADFGVWGVVLHSLFNPELWLRLLCYWLIFRHRSLGSIRRNPLTIYLFLLTFAPSFLFYFLFPASAILFFCVVKLISVSNRIVVSSSKNNRSHALFR